MYYMFAVDRKKRCDCLCEDLNRLVPINNAEELALHIGCYFTGDSKSSFLTVWQKTLAEKLVKKFGITSSSRVPASRGVKVKETA